MNLIFGIAKKQEAFQHKRFNSGFLQKFREHKQIVQKQNVVQKQQIFKENPFLDQKDNRKLNDDKKENQTGNLIIDEIIKSSKIANINKRPIIIINHSPEISQKNEQYFDQFGATIVDQSDIPFQFITKTPKQNTLITNSDINTLVEVLSRISTIYHSFFDGIPKLNDPKESKLKKTVQILQYYAKLRKFVKYIYDNQKELSEDINYLNNKIHLLKSTEQDMLLFYQLDFRYYQAVQKYRRLGEEGFKQLAQQIQEQFKLITLTAVQYDTDIKNIFSGFFDIQKFSEFLVEKIQEINRLDYDSTIMNALDKIDDVLMATYDLINLKNNLELSVVKMREGFTNLVQYKGRLTSYIENVEELVDLMKLSKKEKVVEEDKGFLVVVSFLIFLI